MLFKSEYIIIYFLIKFHIQGESMLLRCVCFIFDCSRQGRIKGRGREVGE